MVVVRTDGVSEAMNPAQIIHSDERLRTTLSTVRSLGVEETIANIMESVKAHAAGALQPDDITVLALKRSRLPRCDTRVSRRRCG